MGGAFVTQLVSGFAMDLFPQAGGVYPLAAYRLVFALQAVFLLVALFVYRSTHDPRAIASAPVPARKQSFVPPA